MATAHDLEYAWLGAPAQGSLTGTLAERRRAFYTPSRWDYFSSRSGLTPVMSFSMQDHRLAFYRNATSMPSATLSDARRVYWGG